MLYSIRSHIPGRLRLACGCPFEKTEARGIEAALLAVEGIRSVEAHESNATLLICCEPAVEHMALEAVASLNPLALPVVEPTATEHAELALAAEDNRFVLEAGTLVVWRLIRRFLLPLLLRTAWVVWQALGFLADGLRCLATRGLTVEVLDATAIGASLARGTFGEADTIMFLLQLSEVMERHVSSRARLALEQGLVARDDRVIRVVNGRDVEIGLTDLAEGDVVHVRSGMVMPVDGVVTAGEGEVDEASMTGEARLVHKSSGASTFAGTALVDGDLLVTCTTQPGQARIDAITQMVDRASQLKGSSESRAERLADALVPGAFAAFLAIYILTRNIDKSLAVLMVDYSCALKISTPIAVMSAMREAASRGIVIKGGRYLEALADADAVVFDKTGTLTEASPRLTAVVSAGQVSESEILRLAACIEEHYPHSVARAIVDGARERRLSHEPELHADVRYVVAHGIAAEVAGAHAVIGSAHFVFEDEGVPLPEGFFSTCCRGVAWCWCSVPRTWGRAAGCTLRSGPPAIQCGAGCASSARAWYQ